MPPSEVLEAAPGSSDTPTAKMPPLWVFFALVLPAAAGAPLAVLLRREGVPVDAIARELALLSLPNLLYFLWGPVTDLWLRRRSWIILCALVGALFGTVPFFLASLASPASKTLLLLSAALLLMTSAAAGGIKAETVPSDKRALVAGVGQSANLGGGALILGGLTFLVTRASLGMIGVLNGLATFLPAVAAFTIDEPAPARVTRGTIALQLRLIGHEFKSTFLRWSAVPTLLLLLSPLSSGALVPLLPGIAPDYGVSVDQIAWMNGIAGGLLSAAGAMLSVLIPGRIDLRLTYSLVALINAGTLGFLCLGPPRPFSYFLGTTLFLLSIGAGWALFTAVVLQLLGKAGASGSGRYAIAVSLGSAPYAYMAVVDGFGAKHFGTRGLAGIDMVVSGASAAGFLVWLWVGKGRGRAGDDLESVSA